MASKKSEFKDKPIQASLIKDYYNRLNALRSKGGVAVGTSPAAAGGSISFSNINALYNFINDTKSKVSFLKNVGLPFTSNPATQGSVATFVQIGRLESNIRKLEYAGIPASNSSNFSNNKSQNFFHVFAYWQFHTSQNTHYAEFFSGGRKDTNRSSYNGSNRSSYSAKTTFNVYYSPYTIQGVDF